MRHRWTDERLGVLVDYGDKPGSVVICLDDLAVRRLILGLGVNTTRYGPEVSTLLRYLCELKFKVSHVPAWEQNSPHGPGHDCGYCREAFDDGEDEG